MLAPSRAVAAAALVVVLVARREAQSDDTRCHPSYPEDCIPPPPPDLDCADLRDRGLCDIAVRGSDPHRLDRDHDGIACECHDEKGD